MLNETRKLRISLPQGYQLPEFADERYAVLIALDADLQYQFAITPAAAWGLATADAPAIPRLIVVGVETPDPKRYHDMSPPFPGAPQNAGGAPAFLRFLSSELRPYLSARYRTNSVTVLLVIP